MYRLGHCTTHTLPQYNAGRVWVRARVVTSQLSKAVLRTRSLGSELPIKIMEKPPKGYRSNLHDVDAALGPGDWSWHM